MDAMTITLLVLLSAIVLWFFVPSDTGSLSDSDLEEVKDAAEELEETREELEAKLKTMTKVQIEDYAREHGVELDKRATKLNMIKQYLEAKG